MRVCCKLLFLLIMLVGCENYRIVEYPLPDATARPFVIGLLSANATEGIHAAWTTPVGQFRPDPTSLDSLNLDLFQKEEWVQALVPTSESLFRLSNPSQLTQGEVYKLEMSCSTCETMYRATDTLPAKALMQEAQTLFDSTRSEYLTQLTFLDVAGRSYYGVRQELLGRDSLVIENDFRFESTPTEIRVSEVFTDEGFENEAYAYAFEAFPYFGEEEPVGMRVYVYSFSRAAYRWKESLGSFEGSWGDYLAAPIEVESNFSHGVGFFGFYQVDSLTLYFE